MFLIPCTQVKMRKTDAGRVNKMHFKHIHSTFQSRSVQTHQSLILTDFNFAKIWKHSVWSPLAAFACSTVRWFWVKTQLVRTGHIHVRPCHRKVKFVVTIMHTIDHIHISCVNIFHHLHNVLKPIYVRPCHWDAVTSNDTVGQTWMSLAAWRNYDI